MTYNIHSGAIFYGKYLTSYLGALVMFALSLTIYEIFGYSHVKKNAKTLTLKMKVNVKE